MKKKVILSWSGGKDSAMALHKIKRNKDFELVALLTTVTEGYDRISMHGVRRILLNEQAKSIGTPLETVLISKNASHEEYDSKMKEIMSKYLNLGVASVIFGDIFLEDVKKYREDRLSKVGMNAIFPLWKMDTAELARDFIDSGFRSITTCCDTRHLNKKFVGRYFDKQFLSELPPSVDPCGENGEFHSFVFAGPIFQKEIAYTLGEIVLRDKRFYYCDLKPIQNGFIPAFDGMEGQGIAQ